MLFNLYFHRDDYITVLHLEPYQGLGLFENMVEVIIKVL